MSSPYFVELHNAYIYSLPVAFTIIYTRIVVKSRDSESRPPECTTDSSGRLPGSTMGTKGRLPESTYNGLWGQSTWSTMESKGNLPGSTVTLRGDYLLHQLVPMWSRASWLALCLPQFPHVLKVAENRIPLTGWCEDMCKVLRPATGTL